jgi:ATP-dependent DNA ligase
MKIQKPTIPQIPMTQAGNLSTFHYCWQIKSDGRHEFWQHRGGIFNAERMRDKSLVVNDVVFLHGEDCTGLFLKDRWQHLIRFPFPSGVTLCRLIKNEDDLQGEIERGSEGAVLKPWDSQFGCGWIKLKRSENFIVKVTTLNGGKNSAQIADSVTGENRGSIPLRGGKVDRVRVGSILKVNAFGAHPSGLLREAKPDDDSENSWLISY